MASLRVQSGRGTGPALFNVALTRARRKVLIVGDSATLGCHPFYQALLSYFESIGAYHSVWEEDDQTT
jgi:superfamily I DNA and/or RNA helicase